MADGEINLVRTQDVIYNCNVFIEVCPSAGFSLCYEILRKIKQRQLLNRNHIKQE